MLLNLKSLMSGNKMNYSNTKVVTKTSAAACILYLKQTCHLPLFWSTCALTVFHSLPCV